MRIVSLLPSLTELVCALGRRDELVGVTHECDFPAGVEALPHLTRSRIPTDASSAMIDTIVSEQAGSLYTLDETLMEQLRPDLVLTQSQCDVCAVNEQVVRQSAARLSRSTRVESVNPLDIKGIHSMFRVVGELLDSRDKADALISSYERTVAEITRRRGARPRQKTLLLEWLDPPFSSGHWNPEIIAHAGGEEVASKPGQPSRRMTWDEVVGFEPEVVLIAPCGFTLERSEQELPSLFGRPEWQALPAVRFDRVALVDGSAYFARPGPRIEQSLRIAAATIDPEACGDLAPTEGWRRIRV